MGEGATSRATSRRGTFTSRITFLLNSAATQAVSADTGSPGSGVFLFSGPSTLTFSGSACRWGARSIVWNCVCAWFVLIGVRSSECRHSLCTERFSRGIVAIGGGKTTPRRLSLCGAVVTSSSARGVSAQRGRCTRSTKYSWISAARTFQHRTRSSRFLASPTRSRLVRRRHRHFPWLGHDCFHSRTRLSVLRNDGSAWFVAPCDAAVRGRVTEVGRRASRGLECAVNGKLSW
jgi:hypothetical protein